VFLLRDPSVQSGQRISYDEFHDVSPLQS